MGSKASPQYLCEYTDDNYYIIVLFSDTIIIGVTVGVFLGLAVAVLVMVLVCVCVSMQRRTLTKG